MLHNSSAIQSLLPGKALGEGGREGEREGGFSSIIFTRQVGVRFYFSLVLYSSPR